MAHLIKARGIETGNNHEAAFCRWLLKFTLKFFVMCGLVYADEMQHRTNSEDGLFGWYGWTRMITGQIGSGSKLDPVPAVAAALQIGVAHARLCRPFGMPLSSESPQNVGGRHISSKVKEKRAERLLVKCQGI